MFLFNRSVLYRGDVRKIRPYTESLTHLVREVSGVPVSLWQGMLGGPMGTMIYSALVHDRAEFDGQMMMAMQGDNSGVRDTESRSGMPSGIPARGHLADSSRIAVLNKAWLSCIITRDRVDLSCTQRRTGA